MIEKRSFKRFGPAYYFHVLTSAVREPRSFFSDLPPDTGLKKPLGFLLCSCIFFTSASLLRIVSPNPVLACILLVNAAGMVLISAGFGYMLMIMFIGKKVSFARFFSVYAFSSGVTLLVSWVPFFIWLTEPWKWWLIGTGMVRALEFKWSQALGIVGLSLVLVVLFFRSAMALF